MKKPFGGSRPGLYTSKKRTKARSKPYSEDAEFQSLAEGLLLFGVVLQRRPMSYGIFDYSLNRFGETTELTNLNAARKLLGALWMNWGKQ